MTRGPNQSRSQKRAAKTKDRVRKRRGQPGSTGGRQPRFSDSLEQYTALEAAFRDWLVDSDVCPDPDAAAGVGRSIGQEIAVLTDANPGFATTAWRPEDIDYLLDVVLASDLVVDDTDARHQIVAATVVFLDFLHETGTWSGSEDDFDYCMDAVLDYIESESPDLTAADLAVPEVDPAEELRALTGLPGVKRLTALLDWVGRGRPVTSTGALKLALVPEAAALFGVHAVVATRRRTQAATEPGLFPEELDQHPTPVPGGQAIRVRSMWDLPELADAWSVAVAIGLLTVGSTTARPGPAAELWGKPDTDPHAFHELCRRAVSESIVARLTRTQPGPLGVLEDSMNEAVAQVVLLGFTDQPVPSDAAERGRRLAELDDTMLSDALDKALFTRVEELVAEGILDATDGYRVRDPLKPAVHQALRTLTGEGSPAPGAPSNALYTLKISLKNTSPPVWRRIVLEGDLTLDEVHDVIQECFDWNDSHMHEFSLGPAYSGGPVYVPSDQMAVRGLGRREATPEESITLAEVLPSVGDSMTYLYDFGDDWIHEVRVETITEDDAATPTHRCITGRGMSPHEDSGGPWGWADLVAVANDPEADDPDDIREWLGLAEGERIDPKAFDVDALDARLRRLLG